MGGSSGVLGALMMISLCWCMAQGQASLRRHCPCHASAGGSVRPAMCYDPQSCKLSMHAMAGRMHFSTANAIPERITQH